MNHLYIAAEMIEAAGIAEVGVDLYVGDMPHDVRTGVMLRDPLYGADIDEGMEDFYDHWFQVIVRDTDPKAGFDKAVAISKLLKVDHIDHPELYIVKMNPSTRPATYPRGDADDVETAVRIHVAYGDKS